ncbi:hypothetical protein [Novosphingobium terrae]|uniref:hypothetical protein n=1 Tax=Novosphingobium terrae TaxID=2726189 RepID=UPI00197EDF0A|nr:hypothetical protein [Novosphingobium terrae]
MGRQIVSKDDVAVAASMGTPSAIIRTPDTYIDRLMKYIPPEVVAVYATLESMIGANSKGDDLVRLSWLVFAVVLVACPLYLRRLGGVSKKLQLTLSTFAFFVWAFAYGGPPFSLLQIAPIYGAILLTLTTFLMPIIEA